MHELKSVIQQSVLTTPKNKRLLLSALSTLDKDQIEQLTTILQLEQGYQVQVIQKAIGAIAKSGDKKKISALKEVIASYSKDARKESECLNRAYEEADLETFFDNA